MATLIEDFAEANMLPTWSGGIVRTQRTAILGLPMNCSRSPTIAPQLLGGGCASRTSN